MSGSGAPKPERLDGAGMRVAVIAARWHAAVTDALIAGASRAIAEAGATGTVFRVPGSFELPVVAAAAAADDDVDAVVALGVVIRGDTPHFEYVCRAVTDGLTRVALDTGIPVGFGVLTCDDEDQAIARSGLPGSSEDKGYEAAHAAISTALTLRTL